MGLFDVIENTCPQAQETAEELINSFRRQAPCGRCHLSEVCPDNPGFLYRGNIQARIAVLTDFPFAEDMAGKSVFCGPGRRAWARILTRLNLKEDSCFLTFVAHCRTDKNVVVRQRKKGRKKVDAISPENANKQDVLTCFNLHTLQILGLLPHLEVIIATGKLPVQMLLKEEFSAEKQIGNFFISQFFPKVPVFILDHPREYDIAGDFKLAQLEEHLEFFENKYLKNRDILRIHGYYKNCLDSGHDIQLNHDI